MVIQLGGQRIDITPTGQVKLAGIIDVWVIPARDGLVVDPAQQGGVRRLRWRVDTRG